MEQKTEIPGMYKVGEGIIINKDNESLAAYKKQRQKNVNIEKMFGEVETMKNDINEIKQLLKQLVKV